MFYIFNILVVWCSIHIWMSSSFEYFSILHSNHPFYSILILHRCLDHFFHSCFQCSFISSHLNMIWSYLWQKSNPIISKFIPRIRKSETYPKNRTHSTNIPFHIPVNALLPPSIFSMIWLVVLLGCSCLFFHNLLNFQCSNLFDHSIANIPILFLLFSYSNTWDTLYMFDRNELFIVPFYFFQLILHYLFMFFSCLFLYLFFVFLLWILAPFRRCCSRCLKHPQCF